MLDQAHEFVLSKIKTAVLATGVDSKVEVICDLTIENRKFAGNAMRCKRDWMLYHGTLLFEFDLDLIEVCLGRPRREPDYRAGRSHREFLVNLPVSVDQLRNALIQSWGAETSCSHWPADETRDFVAQKYMTKAWTFKC